jgi:two-component system, OmpR family, sensor histidine kinase QseC
MPAGSSIRTRLLAGILIALVLILGTAAWWSYRVGRHESEELFSARLATSARVLEALVSRQLQHATLASPIEIALPKALALNASEDGSEYGHPYETKIAFQVWRDDGALLAHSMNAPTTAFAPRVAGFSNRTLERELYHVFTLHSGSIWIQVAEKDEVRAELVHDLGVAVMTPLVTGALLLLVVVNIVVLLGLAPLRHLATGIRTRRADSLARISLEDLPSEIAPVVGALNDLLGRVRHAFERERRFTDAAAHELRTPIAALKIHADNLTRAASPAERDASIRKLCQAVERATSLAEQMLAYSRSQGIADPEQRIAVAPAELLRETIAETQPLRAARSQRVVFRYEPPAEQVRIEAEPTKLRRLLVNVLDNAARYAPHDTEILVDAGVLEEKFVFSVANQGEPIPTNLRERVFEPYYRVPGSGSEGSGLGLAIVQEIANQHGAHVELSSTQTEATVLRVTFPLSKGSTRAALNVGKEGELPLCEGDYRST